MKKLKIDYNKVLESLKFEFPSLIDSYDLPRVMEAIKKEVNNQINEHIRLIIRLEKLEEFKKNADYHFRNIVKEIGEYGKLLLVDNYHLKHLTPLLEYYKYEELEEYFLKEAEEAEVIKNDNE